MVSVGDIEVWNGCECFCYAVNQFVVVDYPEVVSEAVGSREIVFGRSRSHGADNFFEFFVVGECEEYRLNVGVVDAHVFHAVFFLVSAGKLMLFDATLHIVFHVCRHHNAVLRASVHGLGVYVVVVVFVLNEPAIVAEGLEVFYRFVVYFGGVLVGSGSEVYFRLDYMVQRAWVAFGFGAGFFAVENVVGARCHFGDKFARRAYASEWFDFSHGMKK